MKKNKNKNKNTNNSFPKTLFYKRERFRLLTGLFFIAFALYLSFSMFSYFFTWQNDNVQWIDIVSPANVQLSNWGGKLGAYLSYILIYKGFGISALAFPVLIIHLGLEIWGLKVYPLKRSIPIILCFVIILSLCLGLIDGFTSTSAFLLGGQNGFLMTTWLNSFMGVLGTIVSLLVLVLTYSVLVSKRVYHWVSALFIHQKWFQKYFAKKDEATTVVSEKETKSETTNEVATTTEPVNKEEILVLAPEDQQLEVDIDNDEEVIDVDLFNHSEPSKTEVEKVEVANNEPDINQEEASSEQEEEEEVGLSVNELEEEEACEKAVTSLEKYGEYDPRADLSHYQFPDIQFLADHEVNNTKVTQEELNENKNKIVETLRNYKIEITNISATIGPSITLYEIVPAPGVRISKIKNLEDDIALSLAALGIRIIAPMPGKGTVGIEVPNKNPQVVSMRSTIASKAFQENKYQLPIILGKNIYNKTHVIDLAKTPHMLVAGATGQGKSVGINAILTSLLYKKHPAELKFVLIDPKKVELSIYSKIEKHYLAKLPDEEEAVITDVQKVVATLNSLTKEMDTRYDLLKNAHVRNIIEYNQKFINRKLNPEKGHRYLPYIVVVIDEFADLIMTAGKEVEHPIARIAQLARAVGIHLIVATQRPSTNVITGMIKANFPTRVAFRVMQMIDSRTILDSPGANQLIGRGDMLISQGGGEMVRLQCPFVDTPEVEEVVSYINEQQSYPMAFLLPEPDAEALGNASAEDLGQRDEMFEEAARLMVATQQGSTSSIQRKFSLGYNRAGRIMDQLEAVGIVGPYEGSKARKVLIPDEYTLEQFLKNLN